MTDRFLFPYLYIASPPAAQTNVYTSVFQVFSFL